MSYTGLIVGSIIFPVLGIIGYLVASAHINRIFTDRVKKRENKSLACVVAFMCVFCMWLHWICAYMHQMNPITPPIPEEGHN